MKGIFWHLGCTQANLRVQENRNDQKLKLKFIRYTPRLMLQGVYFTYIPHNPLSKSQQFLSLAQSRQHVVSLWLLYPSTKRDVFLEVSFSNDLHQSLPVRWHYRISSTQPINKLLKRFWTNLSVINKSFRCHNSLVMKSKWMTLQPVIKAQILQLSKNLSLAQLQNKRNVSLCDVTRYKRAGV